MSNQRSGSDSSFLLPPSSLPLVAVPVRRGLAVVAVAIPVAVVVGGVVAVVLGAVVVAYGLIHSGRHGGLGDRRRRRQLAGRSGGRAVGIDGIAGVVAAPVAVVIGRVATPRRGRGGGTTREPTRPGL